MNGNKGEMMNTISTQNASFEITTKVIQLYKEMNISPETILQEFIYSKIHEKVDKYEAECLYYKKKHKTTLDVFRKNFKHESENFSQDDDLNDWEFASHNLVYWKSKLSEFK